MLQSNTLSTVATILLAIGVTAEYKIDQALVHPINLQTSSSFNSSLTPFYAPFESDCPAFNYTTLLNKTTFEGYVRTNSLIGQDEYSYISARNVKSQTNLIHFLDDLEIPGYENSSFADYFDIMNQSKQCLLVGAGELMALDSRTTANSSLKGLLDSANYITGLSGGSILLSTLVFNNWTSVEDIVNDNETSIWNTTAPPVSSDISFWLEITREIQPKKQAGYDISLLDVYGRILSRYMFEKSDDKYGLNTLWSDAQDIEAFQNFDMPFPMILTAGGTEEDVANYSLNMFEINPFEFGSYSPFVGGFIPIEILGSQLSNGLPVFENQCTYDFDNVGFLTATSSNILASFQPYLPGFLSGNANSSELLYESLGANVSASYFSILLNLVNNNLNETLYGLVDNPFYNTTLSLNDTDIDGEVLKLVDGGFFSEGLPLDPILVPSRQVDIVFAFDNSGDTVDSWPNGTTLYSTEQRWLESFPDDDFYLLPNSTEEFVELGLNKRPVFFGCNGTALISDLDYQNATVDFDLMKPLLVYIPNTNYTTLSNVTGYVFTYEERNAIIENGFQIAQYDEDEYFAKCVGCAIIRRSEERLGLDISPFCQECFEEYCYESIADLSSSTNETDYFNNTRVENNPTSIYSSSILPSTLTSLLSRSTGSVAFPTTFSTV
ncbi:hypothetical protein CANINC_000224 [Pichia inconspicua]|uniref:Lysophospholipase n=1 Tax=Pichia inconspicua TaxID=52247 RepID=A0A4T0X7X5_9ASCO|nr:hypothetical protein CANINC_000224 [[Candida] inconspicua]